MSKISELADGGDIQNNDTLIAVRVGGNVNKLDGLTATTTELNYVDGVTSPIQDQLDDKAPIDNPSFTGGVFVSEASSGATANTNADGIVIENSDKTGISILTPNTSEGLIFFADPDDNNIGRIAYDHSTDSMSFVTNDDTRIKIGDNGDVSFYEDTGTTAKMVWDASAESLGIGTASPSYPLHISTTLGYPLLIERTISNASGILFAPRRSNGATNWWSGIYGIDRAMTFNVASGENTNSTEERMRIDSSGNVGIGTSSPSAKLDVDGDIIADGIYLGGTSSANKLDDYEEGTWTPVFRGSATAGSYTYLEQQGRYVKVGNLVTVWCTLVDITISSAGTGLMVVDGLPFTIPDSAVFARSPNGSTRIRQVATGFTAHPNAFGNRNSNHVLFLIPNGTADAQLDIATYYASNMDIGFTLTYTAS